MLWEKDGLRFSRPVRWLCAKLDKTTLKVEVAGLESGHLTYGHRFTGGEVEVPRADEYVEVLRAAGVEPEQDERRRQILEGLDAIGGWRDPPACSRRSSSSSRAPSSSKGRFDERFLELPPRVVETAMQSHQRYFPLEGARFAFVANGGEPEVVVAGNERVLEGRLADAHFTFERDVAKGIEALAGELGAITFVAGAGSFADKAARLQALVEELGGGEASHEAARLAKADQAAELVREFPDLEGHIGAEYARLAGFPEAVAPRSRSSTSPTPRTGRSRTPSRGGCWPPPRRSTTSRSPSRSASGRPARATRTASAAPRSASAGSRSRAGCRSTWARSSGATSASSSSRRPTVRDDPSDVADFVFERLEGILDVPVEFVRAARAAASPSSGAWPTSPGPWRGGLLGGVRAGLRRLRPLEPPGGARRRRGGRARPRPGDRRGREGADRGARRGLAAHRGRPSPSATSGRRSRPRPSSARRSTASSTRCS